LIEETKWSS